MLDTTRAMQVMILRMSEVRCLALHHTAGKCGLPCVLLTAEPKLLRFANMK